MKDFIFSRPIAPVVVGVVETWFNASIPDVSLNVPSYSILRFDRPTHGGGVMLLVANRFNIIECKQFSFGHIQVLYADIGCSMSKVGNVVRYVCVYRPPNTDMESSLLFLNALKTEIAPLNCNKLTIIMGDFNLTKIDWSSSRTVLNHSTADTKLLLFSQRCGYKQIVSEPTHDNNFTDLIFVSHENVICEVNVNMPFSTSIHNSVEILMLSNALAQTNGVNDLISSYRLDFDKIDHAGLASDLIHTDWSAICLAVSPMEVVWEKFSAHILQLITKFAPIKAFKRYSTTFERFPPDIVGLIHNKKAAWSLYRKSRRECDKCTFRVLAKLVRVRINAFRKEREERVLRSSSIKQFYAYARQRLIPVTQIAHLRDPNGQPIVLDRDKATAFNAFFHSVFTIDNNELPEFARRTDLNMSLPIFSPADVRKALLAFKNSSSCGPDGCSIKFLKLFPELCLPLSEIFNMSLKQQVVPSAWKVANVIPIFKGKGSKLSTDNYRPISLTNVFCKLMESLVRAKVISFLDCNNLISPFQWGFRSGRSTLSQLLLSKSKLVDCFNDRACADAVFTDMSKAFDSISHRKLLIKMRAYGINVNVCEWVKDFLTHRRQRVVINNCMSDWLPCTSGVPQGSVLGPILFLIFINDLPDTIVNSDIFLFADDAKIIKRIDSRLDCVLFQRDIDAIAVWCNLWQLKLNVPKCVSLRFGLVNRPDWNYSMSGVPLPKALSTKDLGVIFDSKLSFTEHCHTVANKGFALVNMLLRCFHSHDRILQVKLFNSFVRPILDFNSPIWSPHLLHDVHVIERVQKYFTKHLSGLKHESYTQRLFLLHQPSLQQRRIATDLIFLYKILHGLVDNTLQSLFVKATDVSLRVGTLRGHAYKLFLPKPRSDMLKFNYVYRVAKYWNTLPASVCEAQSLPVFKKMLLKHMSNDMFRY